MNCPCMRILKNRSFILAAGLFALVGALLFAGGAFSSASKGAGDPGDVQAVSGGSGDETPCEKVHTLFRRKAPDGEKLRTPEACCPALTGQTVPAPSAAGIE